MADGDSSGLKREDGGEVNPGMEGPNAMYVKLIASDGHEFIIKRDHALTSGTVKALLSGPGEIFEVQIHFLHVHFLFCGCGLIFKNLNNLIFKLFLKIILNFRSV